MLKGRVCKVKFCKASTAQFLTQSLSLHDLTNPAIVQRLIFSSSAVLVSNGFPLNLRIQVPTLVCEFKWHGFTCAHSDPPDLHSSIVFVIATIILVVSSTAGHRAERQAEPKKRKLKCPMCSEHVRWQLHDKTLTSREPIPQADFSCLLLFATFQLATCDSDCQLKLCTASGSDCEFGTVYWRPLA